MKSGSTNLMTWRKRKTEEKEERKRKRGREKGIDRTFNYLIQLFKDTINPIFGILFFLIPITRSTGWISQHLVDCIHNVVHFISRYESIVINIIQLKCPCFNWKNMSLKLISLLRHCFNVWNFQFNLQISFSSRLPLEVTDKALMNSSNSIDPSLLFVHRKNRRWEREGRERWESKRREMERKKERRKKRNINERKIETNRFH